MAIYTFDESGARRIVNAVKKFENKPLGSKSQRRRNRAKGSKQDTITVKPCKITSGTRGMYQGFVLNDDGTEPTSPVTVSIIATRATGYDLPAGSYVVGMVIPTETLGGNP